MSRKIRRVLIETQSNKLFRGIEAEQDYDQRGGLCQVGEGHVIVVTNPIDQDYLVYWENLGFTLPKIIHAGPFNESHTLSELIINNEEVQEEIKRAIGDDEARLEFFWVEESERKLAETLKIPPYCDFDVATELACKHRFKEMCEELDLNTAPWVGAPSAQELIETSRGFFSIGNDVLVKSSSGTGGISLGSIRRVQTHDDLVNDLQHIERLSFPLIAEKMVDKTGEVSVHWEMHADGSTTIIGFFDQLARNFSYFGTAYPTIIATEIRDKIEDDLMCKFIPYLQQQGAKGFFCCDLLIDKSGAIYWTDFNPRKGAIVYVHDFAKRIAELHFAGSPDYYFWHEHTSLAEGVSFTDVRQELADILIPSNEEPFVVITNPGIISHGSLDITGFSLSSREDARKVIKLAKGRFNV